METSRPRVLMIEDDAAIRRGVVDALGLAGYRVSEADRVAAGAELVRRGDYDLLLLDLVLPDGDGLAILREAHTFHPATPVIVLTARGDESDRVAGLERGADDYVVKPFSVRELLARVEAVLRRSPMRPSLQGSIRLGAGLIDLDRREVRFDSGARAALSERETELVRYLAGNAGRVVRREEILSHVWQLDPRGLSTRTVDMHIARLREKLAHDADQPQWIETVHGLGYRWAEASP